MSKFQLPLEVRLTVDSLRAQVVHVFSGMEQDIQLRVGEAIDRQLATLDFDGEISRLISTELKRQVESVTRDVIWQALRHESVEEAVRSTVTKAIKAAGDLDGIR
jgi:hypothetical protein